MCRLTRLYASNVLTVESITAAGDDLSCLKFDLDHQLDDESLGIGTDTWGHLAELEEEHELKPFFSAVRKFYIASIKKMLAKFPFGDSLLKNLGVLQPEKLHHMMFTLFLVLLSVFHKLDWQMLNL